MGQIISEGRTPLVVMWEYRYIPLGLFGRVLEVAVLGAPAGGAGEVVSYGRISDGLSDKEQITEIIHILGSIMNNLLANGVTAQVSEEILLLLGDASDIVGRNRDVVSLVLDILEQDICEAQQGRAASTDAVVTGIEFTTALARSLPGRVWPFLARSALLERHGHGGALSAIVSTLEVSKGDYIFTLAALDLFHHLVEEALHTCVSTHNEQSPERTPGRSLMMLSGSNGLSARTGSAMGVSRSVQAEILAEFTRWAIEVFESYRGWRYNTGINHRLQIGKLTKSGRRATTN
jgi:nuclear pore complex protein Nup188